MLKGYEKPVEGIEMETNGVLRASWLRSAIARRVHRTARTAFVLSGGGNQGVAQVGMLRALLEREIVPDVVIGTSVGALNGAALACAPDLDGIERLAETWRGLDTGNVFPGGPLSRAWNILRRDSHLFDSDGLEAVIDAVVPRSRFEQLALPLRVVATDLDSGNEVVFASGPLKPALLASTALPGAFPPVDHDGRRVIDGGVVDNVPLSHALSGPVDRVYVCNVSGEMADRATRSPLDAVMRAFTIARNQRFTLDLLNAAPDVDVVVLPRPLDRREMVDFSGADALIDEAYHLASGTLDGLAALEPAVRRRRVRRSDVA